MYLGNSSHVAVENNVVADETVNEDDELMMANASSNCRSFSTASCDGGDDGNDSHDGRDLKQPETTQRVLSNNGSGVTVRHSFPYYHSHGLESLDPIVRSQVGGSGGGDCQDFYDFFPSFNQTGQPLQPGAQQEPVSLNVLDTSAVIKIEPEESDPLIDHNYSFIKSDDPIVSEAALQQHHDNIGSESCRERNVQIEDLDVSHGHERPETDLEFPNGSLNVFDSRNESHNHHHNHHQLSYSNGQNGDGDECRPDDAEYEPILSNLSSNEYHHHHQQQQQHQSQQQSSMYECDMPMSYAYQIFTPVNYSQETYSPDGQPIGYGGVNGNGSYISNLHQYHHHPQSPNPMQQQHHQVHYHAGSSHPEYSMEDHNDANNQHSRGYSGMHYSFMDSGDNRMEIKREDMTISSENLVKNNGHIEDNINNNNNIEQQQQQYTIPNNNDMIGNCIDNNSDTGYLDNEPEESYYEPNEPSPNLLSIDEMQQINSKYTHQRFPIKLWNLATDNSFPSIKWSSDGQSLIIDEYTLEPSLGYFFRSKKFSSFLRQLHLYGFRKVTRARNHRSSTAIRIGEEKIRSDYISEYQCNYFQRDRFELVKKVRRFYNNQPPVSMMLDSPSTSASKLSSPSSSSTSSHSISPLMQRSSFIGHNLSSTFVLQNAVSSTIDSGGDGGNQCFGGNNNLEGGNYYEYQQQQHGQQTHHHRHQGQMISPKMGDNSPRDDGSSVVGYSINDNDNCVDMNYYPINDTSCSLNHGYISATSSPGNTTTGNGGFPQSLMAPRSYA